MKLKLDGEIMNLDRHIYLYAKGHYKREDTIEDMRKLVGVRCGIDSECISIADIRSILIGLVWSHITTDYQFEEFIEDLHPSNVWKHSYKAQIEKDYTFDRVFISKCLSVLRFQKVKDIPFNLGKADLNILPLKSIKEKINV